MIFRTSPLYSERDLNPHDRNGHWILSPTCLPIPPSEQKINERKTGFEPATLTLARWCSTPELHSQLDGKFNYLFFSLIIVFLFILVK